jgi:hypothetical protein
MLTPGRVVHLSPEACAAVIRDHLAQGRPALACARLAALPYSGERNA